MKRCRDGERQGWRKGWKVWAKGWVLDLGVKPVVAGFGGLQPQKPFGNSGFRKGGSLLCPLLCCTVAFCPPHIFPASERHVFSANFTLPCFLVPNLFFTPMCHFTRLYSSTSTFCFPHTSQPHASHMYFRPHAFIFPRPPGSISQSALEPSQTGFTHCKVGNKGGV